ncbi:MAG: hypothetical protein M3R36_06200 [Bacteroidota bacterium]|nr:hypothetical protein [Bacteroidota bacterium]
MKDKIKKFTQLLSLFAMFIFASGSYHESTASVPIIPDYSGSWDFTFYDSSGKLQGKKTIVISEDGSFSEKAIMEIDYTAYLTKLSGSISSKGKLLDGTLTDADTFKMEGVLTGNFTDSEGSGVWKNYYKKSGTWKAKRSTKDDKRG